MAGKFFLPNLWNAYTVLKNAVETFPGINDELQLRAWIKVQCTSAIGLAVLTGTTIDDMIVLAIGDMVTSDSCWKILWKGISLLNGGSQNMYQSAPPGAFVNDIQIALTEDGKEVQNPLIIISAVGLLLQVIMFIKNRKEAKS